jgi:hypothetical protein
MSARSKAFARPPVFLWRPKLNDVVYLPDRKPFRRSARGRVAYVMPPLVVVKYFAHGVAREFTFDPSELRPCRGRCRIPQFRKD